MNVLVIGRNGQLATELLRASWPPEARISAVGSSALDVTDGEAVRRVVAAAEPEVIVNASAYTAVDRAEAEPDKAFAVNEAGVRHLALAARGHGIPLVHVSTDYVFDGSGGRPWQEQDEPNPAGVYARSKLAGERAIQAAGSTHAIVRTSWLFAAHGQNFVRTMLRLGAARDRLRIVHDQVGCPTAAADLACVIAGVAGALRAGKIPSGVYHYAGSGPVSWYEFAQAIFATAGSLVPRTPALQPISTQEFGALAPRPAYSVLDCRKIERELGVAATPWLTGLRAVIAEIRQDAG
jgi:dTDP-4-dehydrorhamnose reductase